MAPTRPARPLPRTPPGAPAGGSYWFTTGDPGPARPAAAGHSVVDVAIVGAGFTGLWAAIRLLETDPSLRVMVLEADRVGAGASGRNGGFCAASLTHGLGNGLLHFPDEIDVLEAEGRRNLAELVAFVHDEAIDCDLEATGVLDVATEPWQVPELREWVELSAEHGSELEYLDRDAIQAAVHSPRWLAGVRAGPDHAVMLNPAKLAWGLAAAAERRGATIAEGSVVTGLGASSRRRAPDDRRGRDDRRRPGPGGDVRVQRLDATPRAAVRPGLRLRPDDRAAQRRTSGPRSAGRAARACRTRATSSTTSACRPTTGSCGAATTRSTTPATASGRPTTSGRRRSRSSRPSSLDDVPPARGDPVHARLGRCHRHDDAVHGHVRRGPRRPRPLRARLHGPGRRLEPLGGRHPARPPAPPRLPAPASGDRPVASLPHPDGAIPNSGGRDHAPRRHPR